MLLPASSISCLTLLSNCKVKMIFITLNKKINKKIGFCNNKNLKIWYPILILSIFYFKQTVLKVLSISFRLVSYLNNRYFIFLQIKSPKLHIRSRKAPSPDGFIPHSSKLDNIENNPFFIVWNKGIIENTFIAKNEPVSLKNIKKGISSLFQVSHDFFLLILKTTRI